MVSWGGCTWSPPRCDFQFSGYFNIFAHCVRLVGFSSCNLLFCVFSSVSNVLVYFLIYGHFSHFLDNTVPSGP